METILERLAAYTQQEAARALPPEVLHHAKRAVLDWFAALLPGGVACVATPNADDFLLELAGEPYRQFFYRTAHLWYFSGASLAQLASEARFRVRRIGYVQEYDLANAMLWLREGMPRGNGKIPWIDAAVDAAWRAQLEAKGLASTVYVILER